MSKIGNLIILLRPNQPTRLCNTYIYAWCRIMFMEERLYGTYK